VIVFAIGRPHAASKEALKFLADMERVVPWARLIAVVGVIVLWCGMTR
jgi:hypothetical protein